ncbi:MAG: hypothetical protein AAB447_02275 [Patescibacteria group bacterium]
MFLIQGVFFQNRQYLGLACVPIEGAVVTINEGLFQTMFAGIIFSDQRQSRNNLRGYMLDTCGESVLKDISVSDREVSFTKHYDRRKDIIKYSFTVKHGNTWIGQYSGDAVGVGLARCMITEVDDDFLLPNIPAELLDKPAHMWPARIN